MAFEKEYGERFSSYGLSFLNEIQLTADEMSALTKIWHIFKSRPSINRRSNNFLFGKSSNKNF